MENEGEEDSDHHEDVIIMSEDGDHGYHLPPEDEPQTLEQIVLDETGAKGIDDRVPSGNKDTEDVYAFREDEPVITGLGRRIWSHGQRNGSCASTRTSANGSQSSSNGQPGFERFSSKPKGVRGKRCKKGDNILPLTELQSCRWKCFNDSNEYFWRIACQLRNSFQQKNFPDQQRFVKELLMSQLVAGSFKKGMLYFQVGDRRLCQNCYNGVIGLPRTTFFRWKKEVSEGKINVLPITRPTRTCEPKTELAMEWLRQFALNYGEKVPDDPRKPAKPSAKLTGPVIDLPVGLSRLTVYTRYLDEKAQEYRDRLDQDPPLAQLLSGEDVQLVGEEDDRSSDFDDDMHMDGEVNAEIQRCRVPGTISYTHFCTEWRKRFPTIKVHLSARLSKCKECIRFKDKMKELVDTRASNCAKAELQKEYGQHLKLQNMERRQYYKRINLAITQPENYLSLIIDGMDQKKTDVPHFKDSSSDTNALPKLQTHVLGVICHGFGQYVFLDNTEYGKDSNLNATVLLDVLGTVLTSEKMQKIKETTKTSGPRHLFLQMDNAGDNKNRWIFGFACYLVEKRIFDTVHVGFLLVGHTHEDIDQMFSCFSRYLNGNDVLTLPELMDSFKKSSTKLYIDPMSRRKVEVRPVCQQVTRVFNFQEWLDPYLNGIWCHKGPHFFRFERDEHGKARIRIKDFASDPDWKPNDGITYTEPRVPHFLLEEPPVSSMSLVVPNYSKLGIEENEGNKQGIRRAMPAYEKLMEHKANKQSALAWWHDFIDDVTEREGEASPTDFILAMNDVMTNVRSDALEHRAPTPVRPPMPDIIIGPSKKRNFYVKKSKDDETILLFAPGQMVLLDCRYIGPGYQSWPHVAQVVNLSSGKGSGKVDILWYQEKKGHAWKIYSERSGRATTRVEQTVPEEDIISDGFELNAISFKLPSIVLSQLENYDVRTHSRKRQRSSSSTGNDFEPATMEPTDAANDCRSDSPTPETEPYTANQPEGCIDGLEEEASESDSPPRLLKLQKRSIPNQDDQQHAGVQPRRRSRISTSQFRTVVTGASQNGVS